MFKLECGQAALALPSECHPDSDTDSTLNGFCLANPKGIGAEVRHNGDQLVLTSFEKAQQEWCARQYRSSPT